MFGNFGSGPGWGTVIGLALKAGTTGGKLLGNRIAQSRIKTELEAEFGSALAAEIAQEAVRSDDPASVIEHYRARQEQERLLRNPPPVHGSASWADWHELSRAGLLDDGENRREGTALYLGAFLNPDPELRKRDDNWLFWDGVGHALTVAPSGSGKSLLMLIPNLLRFTGSAVVFDPKGELYRATSSWRARLGPVYRLAPFEEETHAFNPLDEVRDFDDAATLASYIFPSEAKAEGKFYEDEARAWLAAVIHFVAKKAAPETRTLTEVRGITALTGKLLTQFIAAVATSGLGAGAVNAAQVLSGMSAVGRSSLLRSLNAKLAIWDSERLARATARSDVDFRALKHRTATVYITVPIPRLEAYGPFVRSLLTTALEALLDEPKRPEKPILFAVDEFLALGAMPRLASALRTHREAGVRLWYFLQNLADLQRLYPDNWKAFFADTEVQTFFGTKDPYTAELISGFLGETTVALRKSSVSASLSTRGDASDGATGRATSAGVQLSARPLMTPDEVLRFIGRADPDMTRFGINFIHGRPLRTILLSWSRGETLVRRYGELRAAITPSPLLEAIWRQYNETCFDGALEAPTVIGWQDFADGRDEGRPPFSRMLAFYNADIHAIIIVSGFARCEALLADAGSGPLADQLLGFLEGLVLHEMLHQAVHARLGHARHGHGETMLEIVRQVHAKQPDGVPAPTPDTIEDWPGVGDVDEIRRLLKEAAAEAR